MGPLQQPLPFQDRKVFAQRGLADFEDRNPSLTLVRAFTPDSTRFGVEQGLSRSLVFANGLRFTCNRHGSIAFNE